MTLDQLRIFIAVAERRHVTRAAAALGLAQSAASAAIASLETRYGLKLFQRAGRGIELTEAGALFLIEAQAVVARADAAGRVLADLAGLARGTLRVEASQTIASYWLPRHIVAFRRAHPGIDVKLTIANSTQVAAAVREGGADLGFVEGMVDDSALTSTEVARDQLIVVAPPDHPWAAGGPVEAAALSSAEWVMREPGSGTRSVFEDALTAMGIAPRALNVVLELPSNEAVRAAVEAGMGAAALSASAVASSLEAGLLCHAAVALPSRRFHMLRNPARHQSRASETFFMQIPRRP